MSIRITFYNKADDKPQEGDLKYYYNGRFYVDIGLKTIDISEAQLYSEPDMITSEYVVESKNRLDLFTTTKFELAETYANGYNEAILNQDTWEDTDLAKVYFY